MRDPARPHRSISRDKIIEKRSPKQTRKTYKIKRDLEWKDELDGGRGDEHTPVDFDINVFNKAIREESKDHTANKKKALEIVLDHLVEDPKYYDYLENEAPLDSWQEIYDRALKNHPKYKTYSKEEKQSALLNEFISEIATADDPTVIHNAIDNAKIPLHVRTSRATRKGKRWLKDVSESSKDISLRKIPDHKLKSHQRDTQRVIVDKINQIDDEIYELKQELKDIPNEGRVNLASQQEVEDKIDDLSERKRQWAGLKRKVTKGGFWQPIANALSIVSDKI